MYRGAIDRAGDGLAQAPLLSRGPGEVELKRKQLDRRRGPDPDPAGRDGPRRDRARRGRPCRARDRSNARDSNGPSRFESRRGRAGRPSNLHSLEGPRDAPAATQRRGTDLLRWARLRTDRLPSEAPPPLARSQDIQEIQARESPCRFQACLPRRSTAAQRPNPPARLQRPRRLRLSHPASSRQGAA